MPRAASKPKKSDAKTKPVASNQEPTTNLAKAGKRSAKAIKETEEKQAKEARKVKDPADSEAAAEKKAQVPKARPRIERHGKKYREAAKAIDRNKEYGLEEAVKLAQKVSTAKFDASLELHINLGVDPRQADQNIRGTVTLPHGTGKTLRVAVFASENDAKAAKAAGADLAAGDEFLELLKKEQLDFDVLIATPENMVKLGQYAKVLGPKGLMPNPKSGTVTKDVAAAVKAAKTGKVEFRVDKQSIVHAAVGKVSFSPENLVANAEVFMKAVQDARPASLKGIYLKSAVATTTMGPSVRIKL